MTHADRMELTGDFKQGFVDTVRADTKEKTHISATRSEKIDTNTTVFEKGTYTACPSCAEHPERPPLWRLRAEKVIHKNDEQMLYYENASFELYGVPIAYIPLHVGRRSERDASIWLPRAAHPFPVHDWRRHRNPLFLGDRAEHGRDPHADVPDQARRFRRDRISPSSGKWLLPDRGERHSPEQ